MQTKKLIALMILSTNLLDLPRSLAAGSDEDNPGCCGAVTTKISKWFQKSESVVDLGHKNLSNVKLHSSEEIIELFQQEMVAKGIKHITPQMTVSQMWGAMQPTSLSASFRQMKQQRNLSTEDIFVKLILTTIKDMRDPALKADYMVALKAVTDDNVFFMKHHLSHDVRKRLDDFLGSIPKHITPPKIVKMEAAPAPVYDPWEYVSDKTQSEIKSLTNRKARLEKHRAMKMLAQKAKE